MIDERRLYIKQLLRNYKQDPFEMPMIGYTVNYRYPNDAEDRHQLIDHNKGIDMTIQYIDELEHKLDQLQYIEKVIDALNESKNP